MLNDILTRLANSIMLPEHWHNSFILGCNIIIAVLVVALCFALVRAPGYGQSLPACWTNLMAA